MGKGIDYNIRDYERYKNKKIAIIGAGNSAFTSAQELKGIAREITIIHRSEFKADEALVNEVNTFCNFVSGNVAEFRGDDKLKQVIKKAKIKTGEQVKIVTTDGLNAYPYLIKKIFGYNNIFRKYNVEHRKRIGIRGEGFNIMIERLHNNIRARTKTFRGFHGSVKSANAIMKGYEIYYNFITKHQAIEKCPYELATDLKLNSENKWLELIKLSKWA